MNIREKEDWINPGSHYPRHRMRQADELATEFGITRNAVLNLAFRVAYPILRSTLRGMKGAIRSASEAAISAHSQTVPPPVKSAPRARRKS